MALARISITLPAELVAAADRRARQLDRSRSWVVADALRHWRDHAGARAAVGESSPAAYATREVAEARQHHLATELALSPSERLHRAEELGRLAREAQRRGRRQQVIGFDSYEDYYEWKKARLVGV